MRCTCCGKDAETHSIDGTDIKNVCVDCFTILKSEEVSTMGDLSDFAKRNSQFITLADGESMEAVYKGHKIGANTLDASKEVVIYQLETEYGIKAFKSGSCALARLFDNVDNGARIKLTRSGEGNNTKYKLEVKKDDTWHIVEKSEEELPF